jgi:hypothetical protein
MKSLLSLIILLSYNALHLARTTEIITVKAGKLFPMFIKKSIATLNFTPGRVYFKNGEVSAGKLNYSLVLEEILFISPAGDTLALDDKLPSGI